MARLLLVGILLCGCSFIRPPRTPIAVDYHRTSGEPAEELAALSTPRSRDCLLVLLPGIGDRSESFRANGFVEDATGQGCDIALVDATFDYYLAQQAVRRVGEDVLYEARRHGYQTIWLAGISLGGYGAVMTARAYPELVDGVVLIAPMLGVARVREVVDQVIAAGGLEHWQTDVDHDYRHDFQEPRLVWSWLREHAVDRPHSRPLVLGYGEEDALAPRHRLLADALPEGSVVRSEGGHDWSTWRQLWQGIVAQRPWDPPPSQPSTAAVRATSSRRVAQVDVGKSDS